MKGLPMSIKSFRTKLGSDAGALFIEVPFDVKKEFGRARAPVKVSISGYQFESTVAVYGGKYYVPIRKDRRDSAGVKAGDSVNVTLAPDTAVRTVKPPPELSAALANNATAQAHWAKLSYSHKREHADAILKAKRPETRARRVQAVVEKLTSSVK
jgi:hypothetical protein